MTPEQFAYWLQGFIELSNTCQFTEQQTQMIKDHLKLVFDKRTPTRLVPPADFVYNQQPKVPQPYYFPSTEPYKVTCSTLPNPKSIDTNHLEPPTRKFDH